MARCRNCGQPEDWHSAIDGACSDSDGPHVDSELELVKCEVCGTYADTISPCSPCFVTEGVHSATR